MLVANDLQLAYSGFMRNLRKNIQEIKLDKKQERLYFTVYLHGKGKVTDARINILSALSSVYKPLSIKNLQKLVTTHNITTFYRTLEMLVKMDLVKKIATSSGESLYETTIGRHHHHHITCTSCGLLEDVETCAPLPSQKLIKAKGFSTITNHTLEFFGVCSNCTKS
jgi:Fur family transcriptional regulator, ferric uptake regulator